jgi:hypothetical protein
MRGSARLEEDAVRTVRVDQLLQCRAERADRGAADAAGMIMQSAREMREALHMSDRPFAPSRLRARSASCVRAIVSVCLPLQHLLHFDVADCGERRVDGDGAVLILEPTHLHSGAPTVERSAHARTVYHR